MTIVRIEHSIQNFDRWKQAFDNDPADRKGAGVRRYQILRLRDDPNYVMIDLEFDSADKADVFLRNMQRIWDGPGKAVMQNPRGRIAEVAEVKEL